MKPRDRKRSFQSSGVMETQQYSVKLDPHLMSVLSSLYSNIPLALVREYWKNAEDGHIALRLTGVEPPQPIEIHIPNRMESFFSVRDYGIGMDHDTVSKIYTQYGASLKQTNNHVVGGLGLGAKAGFCYEDGADQWGITSFYDGVVRTYVASKDARGMPTLVMLGEQPTDEPNGILINIPVALKDHKAFKDNIRRLGLRALEPFKILGDVQGVTDGFYAPIEYTKLNKKFGWRKNGSGEYGAQAIMGGVPYPIDTRHADLELSSSEIDHLDKQGSVDIFFKIGELDITPSREGLMYTPHTVEKLKTRFTKLFMEDVLQFKKQIKRAKTLWEAMDLLVQNKESARLAKAVGHADIEWDGDVLTLENTMVVELDDILAAHSTPPTDFRVTPIAKQYGNKVEQLPNILPKSLADPTAIANATAGNSLTSDFGITLTRQMIRNENANRPVFVVADCAKAMSLLKAWWKDVNSNGGTGVLYVFRGEGLELNTIKKTLGTDNVGSADVLVESIRRDREYARQYTVRTPANVKRWSVSDWYDTEVDISQGGIYVKLKNGDIDSDEVPNLWKGRVCNGNFRKLVEAGKVLGVLADNIEITGIPKTRWRTFESQNNWSDFWDLYWKPLQGQAARAVPLNPPEGDMLTHTIESLQYLEIARNIDTSKLPKRSPILKLLKGVEKREKAIQAIDDKLARFTAILSLRYTLTASQDGKVMKNAPKGVDIQPIVDYNDWLQDRYGMIKAWTEDTWRGGFKRQLTKAADNPVLEYITLVDSKVPVKNAPKI